MNHVGNGSTMLRVESGVNFVEKVERCRIAFLEKNIDNMYFFFTQPRFSETIEVNVLGAVLRGMLSLYVCGVGVRICMCRPRKRSIQCTLVLC